MKNTDNTINDIEIAKELFPTDIPSMRSDNITYRGCVNKFWFLDKIVEN